MAAPSLLTVGTTPLVGYPGGIAETYPNGIVSAMNESATALDFGQICARGVAVVAGKTQNVKPHTTELVGDIVGVTVSSAATITAASDGTINYPRYSAVPVMKQGSIWVIPVENVVAGAVAVVIDAASGSKLGGGTPGAGRQAIAGVWETTTTTASGVVGLLRLNIP
jgi:hypothetical protein